MMHFHWQNLRSQPRDFPWHGRAWWHRDVERGSGVAAHVEWVLGSRSCAAQLRLAPRGEEALSGHGALPPVALYWGLDSPLLRRIIDRIAGGPTDMSEKYGAREISLKVFEWAVWWRLWVDPGGWTSRRPRWRDGSLHLDDLVLGQAKYSSVDLGGRDIAVPMPEGTYRGKCRLTADTWKRPRWFAKRVRYAVVEMTDPIPFPGKGESSWDCGEDACHSLSTPARSYAEAIAAVVGSVMRSRERYGGLDYVLEKRRPAEAS
jgi:hypothetical protein